MEQGIAQGLAQGIEQGLTQGIAQGMEQGLMQGIEQGIAQERKERDKAIVINSRKAGLSPESIAMISGLTPDEITDILRKHSL
jgi:flagellar biosynthesis/type III secretory pathway protein FliH